jgi:hypothetical protein
MKMNRVLAILAFGVWLLMSTHANESQRNAQPAPEQLGSVHFPSSCSPAVQKQFERGLAGSGHELLASALGSSEQ